MRSSRLSGKSLHLRMEMLPPNYSEIQPAIAAQLLTLTPMIISKPYLTQSMVQAPAIILKSISLLLRE